MNFLNVILLIKIIVEVKKCFSEEKIEFLLFLFFAMILFHEKNNSSKREFIFKFYFCVIIFL